MAAVAIDRGVNMAKKIPHAGAIAAAALLWLSGCDQMRNRPPPPPRLPPQVAWAAASAVVHTSSGVYHARLRVIFDAYATSSDRAITVPFSVTSNGSGEGRRWRVATRSVTFMASEGGAQIDVALTPSAPAEPAETLTFRLGEPLNVVRATRNTPETPWEFRLTLVDDGQTQAPRH